MIKIATLNDLPEIVSIYNASIPGRKSTADIETISVEQRLTWFNQHKDNRPLWVMEKNREIAGWLSLQDFYGRCAYRATAEISVYVKPNYHGQGIAQEMLNHTLREAPKLNVSTLVAFIFAHNEPSVQFFKKNGFSQWGFLPEVAELDGLKKNLVIYGLNTILGGM